MIDGRKFLFAWIMLLAADQVSAGPFDYRGFKKDLAQPAYTEKRGISLEEAISRARRQSDGKVLSAETVRVGDRSVHRIKILTSDGRVKRMQYDAASGRPATRGR